jgi:preprotein translocase subunit SecG
MIIVLTFIHVVICFFLIVVVLLQSGKAADLAGAFGGMGSQTAFGPRGSATLLSKATTLAAALFMVTSLSLAILATRGAASSGSVLEKIKAPAPANKTAPVRPGTPVPVTPVQPPAAPAKK